MPEAAENRVTPTKYLRRYLALFARLPSFELVYVTTASTRLGQAQSVFERVLSRGRKWLTNLADPDRLLAHFRGRELFEKRQTGDFDRDRFDGLRDDMDTFSCPRFAEMFVRWRPPATKLFAPNLPPRRMLNGSCLHREGDRSRRVGTASQ